MSKTSYQRTEWFKSNSNSKNTWHYHDIWPKTWYYHDKCLKHHGTLIVLNNYHIHIYMIHDKKHGSTIIYVHKNSLIMDACRVMQVSGLDSCLTVFSGRFGHGRVKSDPNRKTPLTRPSLTEQVESAVQTDLVQVENPVYQLCRESVCGENLLSRLESQRV